MHLLLPCFLLLDLERQSQHKGFSNSDTNQLHQFSRGCNLPFLSFTLACWAITAKQSGTSKIKGNLKPARAEPNGFCSALSLCLADLLVPRQMQPAMLLSLQQIRLHKTLDCPEPQAVMKAPMYMTQRIQAADPNAYESIKTPSVSGAKSGTAWGQCTC